MCIRHSVTAAAVMGFLLGPVAAYAQVRESLDQAIRTEAARMAADASRATSHASLQDDVNIRQSLLVPTVWPRVYALDPGTEILLTTAGSPPGQRYVLSTGEAGLTVLDLTDPAIPNDARLTLARVARRHPEYLGSPQPGVTHREGRLRLGPDAVFIDVGDALSRKVVSLDDIVEHVDRESVVEIRQVHQVGPRQAWSSALWAALSPEW